MRLVLALAVLFPLSVVAQEATDPTYDECFALMQKKLEAAQAAVDAEAIAIQGLDHTAPASEPSANQQALDKAIENGVPIEIDPFAADGEKIEGKINMVVNAPEEVAAPVEDDKPPVITREQKCKTLYGLTF